MRALCRLDFIDRWLTKGPPVVFWISGLFSPHVFVARVRHAAARRLKVPVDAVSLESTWVPEVRSFGRSSTDLSPPDSDSAWLACFW
jgi:hypothetical protein